MGDEKQMTGIYLRMLIGTLIGFILVGILFGSYLVIRQISSPHNFLGIFFFGCIGLVFGAVAGIFQKK
jgi:hypothetical protein